MDLKSAFMLERQRQQARARLEVEALPSVPVEHPLIVVEPKLVETKPRGQKKQKKIYGAVAARGDKTGISATAYTSGRRIAPKYVPYDDEH
jgi:hypothetical protein